MIVVMELFVICPFIFARFTKNKENFLPAPSQNGQFLTTFSKVVHKKVFICLKAESGKLILFAMMQVYHNFRDRKQEIDKYLADRIAIHLSLIKLQRRVLKRPTKNVKYETRLLSAVNFL